MDDELLRSELMDHFRAYRETGDEAALTAILELIGDTPESRAAVATAKAEFEAVVASGTSGRHPPYRDALWELGRLELEHRAETSPAPVIEEAGPAMGPPGSDSPVD